MIKEGTNVKYTPHGMLRMLAKASKGMLILSVACGVLSGASSMFLIYLISSLIKDNATAEGSQILFYFGVLLVMMISGLATNIFLVRLGQNSMFEMRMRISRQILATPYRKLEEVGSSRIYSMLTDDIQSLVNATQALPSFAINGATIIGGFIYLGWVSPTIFVVSVAFVVIGVTIYQGIARNAWRHLVKARDVNDSLFNHFRAITYGAKELKLNRIRRDDFLTNELEPTGVSFQESYILGLTKFALASQWGRLLFFIMIGLLVFLSTTSFELDNAALVGSVLTVIYLMEPLGVNLNILPLFARADIAAKKIDSLQFSLITNSSIFSSMSSSGLEMQVTVIELENTTYSYTSDTEGSFKLGPIDLVLRPHEIVFLVGGNGSGKSTLLKMLTGLYVPENGEVRVNGKCVISEDDRENYRQLFSVVFADFYLFDRILNDKGPNADELLLKYLELLQLKGKVSIIDGRFSTILLSQGQRKRLALLCAYLEDRPIYVFDEWAADQDPLFKEIFYSQILPDLKLRGKAVLLATHDDRYFHLADRMIKLESGMVVS